MEKRNEYPTKFAIVSMDGTTEYCGIIRRKYERSYCFTSMLIPHKGKRYKTYANALKVAEEINNEWKKPTCKVIETLI